MVGIANRVSGEHTFKKMSSLARKKKKVDKVQKGVV
jgi:hypothetical protein